MARSPLRTDYYRRTLPVATRATVMAEMRALWRVHRRTYLAVTGWHLLASLAGLAGPWAIGAIVQEVTTGGRDLVAIQRYLAAMAIGLIVQTGLTWVARRAALVLSEQVFDEVRRQFMHRAMALPLSTLERAGTGTSSAAPPAMSGSWPRLSAIRCLLWSLPSPRSSSRPRRQSSRLPWSRWPSC